MKVIIVGASGSLGRALALAEAQQKSDLVLVASDSRDLDALKADLNLRYGIRVECFAIDLSKAGALSILALDGDRYYFPVGSTIDNDFFGIKAPDIYRVFQINLLCVAELISSVMSSKRSKSVDIIGFGSIAETRGRTGNVFYSAAKRSLTSLFESLLHSSRRENIRPYLFQIGYMKSQLSFGKKMLFPAADPNDVAQSVLGCLNKKKPGIFYVPGFWRWVCLILKQVPWPIYRNLKF